MTNAEQRENSVQLQKKRIRDRYRGINSDELTIIPAAPTENIYETEKHMRVAVYARVSTDDPNQTTSYELQRNYYEDMVRKHSNWELARIYADEGISGTSLLHRESFIEMIEDCENGKIDLVITKSVSRFARNVEDCIHYSRKLKSLNPPIGILFETEGIYTMNDNSEMQLSFLATLAQEESHNKSESMNRSIEMRFSRGIFLTPPLLGYDLDEDGSLVINDEEAKTVRLIYKLYESGKSSNNIAEILNELERKTKTGRLEWSASSVLRILRNERYCGDVLARKTYTPNYLNHRSVKNRRNRPQYYQEDHHRAIIPRDEFVAVQYMLDSAKYGFAHALPELRVIKDGTLRGFVQINPRWQGFSETDYLKACHSALSDEDYLHPAILLRRKKGDPDLSDYQVSRGGFISSSSRITCSFSIRKMKFSSTAVNELAGSFYVELFYHPLYHLLLVRPSDKKNRHALLWSHIHEGRYRGNHIPGTAFLGILYNLCHWLPEYRYIVSGIVKEQDGQKILLFYCDEPEIHFRDEAHERTAFPAGWEHDFGDEYNVHEAKETAMFDPRKRWNLMEEGHASHPPDLPVFDENRAKTESRALYLELKAEKEQLI